ncbi:MAG: N-acetylglucosamine-6-phosphate deacetylase [Vibrionaceae bacterium]
MYALNHCHILTGHDLLTDHAVIIDQGKIAAVVPQSQLSKNIFTHDLNGAYLSPGFIDLQLNGCGGVMFNDDITADTLRTMQLTNQRAGCTSFLPTLITSSDTDMRTSVQAMREYQKQYENQALGLHLEGPYLNVERKGIHQPHFIRPIDPKMVQFMVDNADMIKKVTLAPELADETHIQRLVQAGIVVSAGHTNATYQEARQGFTAGITFATHLFNAMSTYSGREPGMIGAIFDSPDVYAGIIVDGLHVNYANVRIAHKQKGEKLVLVTDAAAPAGTEMDSFNFVGTKVYYRDGKCVDENGTLGGSALTMIEAVQNSVEHVGIALPEAVRMASLYPAKAIGMADKLGLIQKGYIANLAIFDRRFKVKATVVNGEFFVN